MDLCTSDSKSNIESVKSVIEETISMKSRSRGEDLSDLSFAVRLRDKT
jgi:hypothetical protein